MGNAMRISRHTLVLMMLMLNGLLCFGLGCDDNDPVEPLDPTATPVSTATPPPPAMATPTAASTTTLASPYDGMWHGEVCWTHYLTSLGYVEVTVAHIDFLVVENRVVKGHTKLLCAGGDNWRPGDEYLFHFDFEADIWIDLRRNRSQRLIACEMSGSPDGCPRRKNLFSTFLNPKRLFDRLKIYTLKQYVT